MDPQAAVVFLKQWGYPALALLLGATGVGFPIPEDVLLLTAGYLISAHVFSWHGAVPFAIVGVVGSDCILYWLGTRIRTHSARWIARFIRPDRLDETAPWFRYGDRVVLIARLVPGTRAVVFVGSGLRGLPFQRFLVFDVIGAAIWVPLMLLVGAQIGEEIGGIERLFSLIARTAWWLVIPAILLGITWRVFRAEESKL